MRVLKFGGKSLCSIEKISALTKKVASIKEDVIVVVSAMGDSTSDLMKLAHPLAPKNLSSDSSREIDMLLGSGERVTAALFSLGLQQQGRKSISFTGSQAGVLTDGPHNDATITKIKPFRVDEALKNGLIPVIAGFQGVNPETKDVTTLGRGGSDLTAVAFAHHYSGVTELYKSVGGVHTADPTLIKNAKLIKKIDPHFLQTLSHWGAKILNDKASNFIIHKKVKTSFYSDTDFSQQTQIEPLDEPQLCLTHLDNIVAVETTSKNISQGSQFLESEFKNLNYQCLASAYDNSSARFLLKLKDHDSKQLPLADGLRLLKDRITCVSLISSAHIEKKLRQKLLGTLEDQKIQRLLETENRISFFIDENDKNSFMSSVFQSF